MNNLSGSVDKWLQEKESTVAKKTTNKRKTKKQKINVDKEISDLKDVYNSLKKKYLKNPEKNLSDAMVGIYNDIMALEKISNM